MPGALDLPFFRDGVAEVLLLSVAAGVLGTWVVLRGLAFLSHAVGTATFPGLVLADGLGFSAVLGALGAAVLVAGLMGALAGRRRTGPDSIIALVLAAALAAGIVLASDVFDSGASIDRLLFGSLLLIDAADLRFAAFAALAALAGSLLLGPRWLADGFAGRGLGPAARDVVLVLLIAFVTVASLAAVGALLATVLLVVPAATTRLLTARMRTWQLSTIVLAALEGVGGMWLAFEADVPPGAAIAVIAVGVFILAALLRAAVARRPRGLATAALAVLGALLLAGCGATAQSDGRPLVVATTTQLADIAAAIGEPDVAVHSILRRNSDAHEYEPRPSDVRAVAGAEAVLISGLGFDAWAGEIVKASGTNAPVINAGAAATAGAGADMQDPHWWLDPAAGLRATEAVEAALIRAAPGARAAISARASAYRARLSRLDAAIRECIARVPARERRIVTDHDALGRFTRRYGIDVVGVVMPAAVSRAQASAGDLATLEREIRRAGVRVVFPEAGLSSSVAQRIAVDSDAAVGDALHADALGPEGSRSGTYLGMLAANADALARGMSAGGVSCEVDA
ncbi:unannotated protein [freshwater metagenome]|uniref:Unannotated protein n=1 Tax=freshwater metagenome TaxID=449393 RepID=A0A6J7EA87_9ZZZZ|nr:hypothetical protein [Actinomycetota bacterium]